ncbi:helix-turn-helix domain-containing protein [Priestia endophytica]|jgi:transcriptional regulator with XRE-family HTH domain|uniref:helix-turn-helix domain-containing protein n=1 Tax=Priestia endophytica TaxID=135735 RepID=UPI000F53B600|nr:helix-turn-helix transcriptional regulator [Priestia endophytica]MED4071260.1 helix-turn-helix transcriptional regulator [Priestia endophytica]RPK08816.1 hypothetical protein FH5_04616 [Priestia endophytica]
MNLDRLTELRKKKKWSLQYTADRLGIAKSTYAGYESGYRRPSFEALALLADLFETTCDDLLGRTPHHEQISLEVTEPNKLAVDDKTLTKEEAIGVVAFVRARRAIEEKR